jgi:hypothetical protein
LGGLIHEYQSANESLHPTGSSTQTTQVLLGRGAMQFSRVVGQRIHHRQPVDIGWSVPARETRVGCIYSVHGREQGIWTRLTSRARPVRRAAGVPPQQAGSGPFEVERNALRPGPAFPQSELAGAGHSSLRRFDSPQPPEFASCLDETPVQRPDLNKCTPRAKPSASGSGPPGRRLRAPKKERSFGGVRS